MSEELKKFVAERKKELDELVLEKFENGYTDARLKKRPNICWLEKLRHCERHHYMLGYTVGATESTPMPEENQLCYALQFCRGFGDAFAGYSPALLGGPYKKGFEMARIFPFT